MIVYSLNVCDRAGRTLHSNRVAARDVHAALGKANQRMRQLVAQPLVAIDPQGHIDVTDVEGRTVARLVMVESLAAMR